MTASRSFVRSVVLTGLVAGTACTSNKAGPGGPSGTGGTTGATVGCAQSALKILFNPMYSAYDGVHTFQLPAIVDGIDSANTQLTWSASDPSMVAMQPDARTGGVMMTMQKAGQVTIYAHAGNLCGAAPLTITAATPEEWMQGSKRYNEGTVLTPGAGADGGAAAAQQAACTNCHGPNANGLFKDVAHTPEQTGGFSDQELTDIFVRGTIPAGGYFDPNIVPYALWQSFHQWDVGEAAKGVVVYLRSLTPTAQKGSFNLAALRDAGVPRDSGNVAETGTDPQSDAAPASDDAGVDDGGVDAAAQDQ